MVTTVSYRLKLKIGNEVKYLKTKTLPVKGETVTIDGKPYVIENIFLMKGNLYRVIGVPVKPRRKGIFSRLFRR